MAFGTGNLENSHNFQYLTQAASHNIRYPLYWFHLKQSSLYSFLYSRLVTSTVPPFAFCPRIEPMRVDQSRRPSGAIACFPVNSVG